MSLSHPIATAKRARARLALQAHMWTFAYHGKRRFRGDPRYDLQSVTDGFRAGIADRFDDTHILERICEAYNRTVERQGSECGYYQASPRWQAIRERSLGPVMKALHTRDIPALGKMYRNFFRDPCSAGIIGAPGGLSDAYFSGRISDVYRHFYLSHVLCRLDYWKLLTGGRYSVRNLAGPEVGNSFGVLVEDRRSDEVLLDSEVDFVLRDANRRDATAVTMPASPGYENKLLFTADLDLDAPGARTLDVTVRNANRNATVSMPLEVLATTETGFAFRWSYVVILAVAAALCLVYIWRHRTSNPARLAAPIG